MNEIVKKATKKNPNDRFDSCGSFIIALKELKEHGMLNDYGIEGFYEECGKLEHYEAQIVLQWLGY